MSKKNNRIMQIVYFDIALNLLFLYHKEHIRA